MLICKKALHAVVTITQTAYIATFFLVCTVIHDLNFKLDLVSVLLNQHASLCQRSCGL